MAGSPQVEEGYGHNDANILKLMEEIGATIPQIRTSMETPWETLSTTLSTEWVGPDEIAAEQTFADAMSELFQSCQAIVAESIINIFNAGRGWQQWTGSNAIEGSKHQPDISTLTDLNSGEIELDQKELALTVTSKDFANVSVGIKSAQSEQKITAAIDAYTKSVYDGVKGLYEAFETAVASGFLGADQKVAINEYLKKVGVVLAKTAICVRKLKECVAAAAGAYVKQSAQAATDFKEQNPSLANEENVNTSAITGS